MSNTTEPWMATRWTFTMTLSLALWQAGTRESVFNPCSYAAALGIHKHIKRVGPSLYQMRKHLKHFDNLGHTYDKMRNHMMKIVDVWFWIFRGFTLEGGVASLQPKGKGALMEKLHGLHGEHWGTLAVWLTVELTANSSNPGVGWWCFERIWNSFAIGSAKLTVSCAGIPTLGASPVMS